MGFFGYLKFKNEQTIPILDHDGVNVGNPLAALLEAYEDYVLKGCKSPCYEWFSLLESKTNIDLRIFVRIICTDIEGLSDDEINDLISNWQEGDPITVEEIIESINTDNKWGSIEEVIIATAELIRLLSFITEETFWFSKQDTPSAFQTLLDTLKQCQLLGEEEIRFLFL